MLNKSPFLLLLLIFLLTGLILGQDITDPAELEKRLLTAGENEKLPLLTDLCRLYLRKDPSKVLEYGRTAEELLKKFPDEKTELTLLDLICQAHLYLGDYDQALVYGEKSLELTRKMDYRKGMGVAFSIIAIVHNQKGDYARSREYSSRAVEIFENTGEKRPLAAAYNNIGISYDMQGNYEKALDHYLKSLKLKEEIGEKETIARSLNNVGVILKIMGNNHEALKYYSRALLIKEEMGDQSGIASQYINLGNIHEGQKEESKALEYYRKALVIFRELNNQTGIASALYSMGLLEARSENYRTAQNYFLQALDLRRKMGEKESIAQTLIELGRIYMSLRMTRQAVTTLEEALTLAEEIGALSHIQTGSLALSEAYENRRNFARALTYYKKYKDAGDRIFNTESSRKIAELQARFDSEKQEQEILLLKKNSEIQQLRINRQRILRNLMIAAFILLISGASFLVYRYRYVFTFWKKKNYIGHYRILEQIGSGGMGTVYRAADVVDGGNRKPIAVKVLREEFFSDEVQKKRFKMEASIIDQVVHPNIVHVIERGETENGIYIAMEALEGPTLTVFLQQNVHLPFPTALGIMLQITDALKSIHAMNIVHRDLKPDNIKLIEKDGDPYFVKLLDFGLAITQNVSRLTETGIVVGTLSYLSPEQIAGEPINTASDIHGLGVIFYEMIAGTKPFIGETTLDVLKQIMDTEPINIRTFRTELDRMMADLIMLMLRKDPGQRPSASTIHDHLKRLIAGLNIPARVETVK